MDMLVQTSVGYVAELRQWRRQRAQNLQARDSWLAIAGLFWLKEGPNTIGTDPQNDILLPGSAPQQLGILYFNKEVRLKVSPGVEVRVNGNVVRSALLRSDAQGKPDQVTLGDLSFIVIQRGKRVGVRLFDNSPTRQNFRGIHWFAIRESYRIKARFIPYPTPKTLPIVNILGDIQDSSSPGYVVFSLNGQEHRLVAESKDPTQYLFFNFKDKSSGSQTYAAGRFLTTEGVKDGVVVLDFNRATNPYCAYTPYATCPLAPRENHLSVAIEAGEKKYQ